MTPGRWLRFLLGTEYEGAGMSLDELRLYHRLEQIGAMVSILLGLLTAYAFVVRGISVAVWFFGLWVIMAVGVTFLRDRIRAAVARRQRKRWPGEGGPFP